MKRIYIIGGPGSGKSTLSKKVAEIIEAPLYELDRIGYENGAGAKRPLLAKMQEVDAIAESDSWVAEGVFLWWTEPLAEKADVIVWLDVSWRLAWWRIVSRHFKTTISGTNKHRGLGKLRFFLRGAKRYYQDKTVMAQAMDDDGAVTRFATELELSGYRSKLVRCRTGSDVSRFLHSLEGLVRK